MTDDTTPDTTITAVRNSDGSITVTHTTPLGTDRLIVSEETARDLVRQLHALFTAPAPEETTTP